MSHLNKLKQFPFVRLILEMDWSIPKEGIVSNE